MYPFRETIQKANQLHILAELLSALNPHTGDAEYLQAKESLKSSWEGDKAAHFWTAIDDDADAAATARGDAIRAAEVLADAWHHEVIRHNNAVYSQLRLVVSQTSALSLESIPKPNWPPQLVPPYDFFPRAFVYYVREPGGAIRDEYSPNPQ